MTGPDSQIEICVCTFRRAELADALASLVAQVVPSDLRYSILVIDNDTRPSAEAQVKAASDGSVPIRYLHCPAGNISIARNGALDHHKGRFIAFIDDDEIADPHWVASLWAEAMKTRAAAVLGPVDAVYDDAAPDWMQELDIHSTRPVEVNGRIPTGYSCNVLIDTHHPATEGLRFDLGLGRSGGEDTDFFSELAVRGGHIVYAPDAQVSERVPKERARFAWLIRRRFRMGQTHGLILTKRNRGVRWAGQAGLALSKTVFCAASVILQIRHASRWRAAVLRGSLHFGAFVALLGRRPIELYGAEVRASS